jgi:hypothetical protein
VLQQVDRGYRMPKPMNCRDEYYAIMFSCWKQVSQDSALVARFLNTFSTLTVCCIVCNINIHACLQNADDRPTFLSLQEQLEDFSSNTDGYQPA